MSMSNRQRKHAEYLRRMTLRDIAERQLAHTPPMPGPIVHAGVGKEANVDDFNARRVLFEKRVAREETIVTETPYVTPKLGLQRVRVNKRIVIHWDTVKVYVLDERLAEKLRTPIGEPRERRREAAYKIMHARAGVAWSSAPTKAGSGGWPREWIANWGAWKN